MAKITKNEESQNHRIIWFGRDSCRSSGPAPHSEEIQLKAGSLGLWPAEFLLSPAMKPAPLWALVSMSDCHNCANIFLISG